MRISEDRRPLQYCSTLVTDIVVCPVSRQTCATAADYMTGSPGRVPFSRRSYTGRVDLLVHSIANGLDSAGGFCAGPQNVADHQRISGTSFVFSAALPALLAVSASEGIKILGTRRQS